MPPRGWSRGRGRGGGRGRGRGAGAAPAATTGKCFVCGQVGCKPSTCPKGDPAAQKEHADRQTEREKANALRAVRRIQGAVNVSEDEAVSDGENAEQCLVSSHVPPNFLRNNPELSPEVFPRFLGTV